MTYTTKTDMIEDWNRSSASFSRWCENVGGELADVTITPAEMPNDLYEDDLHYMECHVGDSAVRLYEDDGEVAEIDVDQEPGDDHLVVDAGDIDIDKMYVDGETLMADGFDHRGEGEGTTRTIDIRPE